MDTALGAMERMQADPACNDMLVLVDGLDRQTGTATKQQAHLEGLLHRALSVVLFRDDPEGAGGAGVQVLLSKRADGKYHSAGLWANSCCSHPRSGEDVLEAAYRRVREELGCEAVDLREVAAFAYRAQFEGGLVEHEFDHVFVGRCLGELQPDPAEVAETRWVPIDRLADEMANAPERFAAWAPMVLSLATRELIAGETA